MFCFQESNRRAGHHLGCGDPGMGVFKSVVNLLWSSASASEGARALHNLTFHHELYIVQIPRRQQFEGYDRAGGAV